MIKRFLYIACLLSGLQSQAQHLTISSPGLVMTTPAPLPITSGEAADLDFSNYKSVRVKSGKVDTLKDAVAGVVSSQATSANQPKYYFNGGAGNNGFARFYGSQTLSGALLTSSTNFTCFMVRRVAASVTNGAALGSFQNGSGTTGYGMGDFLGSGSNASESGGIFPANSTIPAPFYITSSYRWEIVVFSHTSGSTKVYNTAGASIPPLRNDENPNTPTTSHTIGACNGANAFQGDITRILLYNRQLSDAEVLQLCQWLCLRYSIAPPLQYISDGDSITSTADGSFLDNYPIYYYEDQLPSHYMFLTMAGYPGYVSQVLIDSLQKHVISHYIPGITNVYSVMIGHNDLSTGTDQAHQDTLFRHIDTICHRVKRAGFKVVVFTTLNTTQYSNAITTQFNNRLIASKAELQADTVYDLGATNHLTDPTNTAYFFDGQTHLSKLGARVADTSITASMNRFLFH